MPGLTLYQAAHDVVEFLDAFDPETGEFPEGFERTIGNFREKGTSIVGYMLNSTAEIDAIETVISRLKKKKEVMENRNKWLKVYLSTNMRLSGVNEIKANDGSFCAKLHRDRDSAVDIFDARQLPEDYMREIPASCEPDKALIKKALNDGFEIPGARILKKDRLEIK